MKPAKVKARRPAGLTKNPAAVALGRLGGLSPKKKKALITEQIHLRLPVELHSYLRERAISDGRTVTGLINFVCEQYRRAHPVEDR